ncbi:MAG: glycosyltransferase family 4 protein [Lachnospiraceae bacterium]|nr:glycosyltransferase family 4 protein [Lachnospiraceae bacterium]
MEEYMNKRVMLIANSASMIDHFNRDNISILQSMGCEITVAANFKEGNSSSKARVKEFKNELTDSGIDVIDLPIPRKVTQLGKTMRSISILKTYLRNNPCKLIHTQTPFGGVVGRLAAKHFRKTDNTKVIYFAHGFHFFKGAPKKNYLIYYNIEKYLSKYTDTLITLNHEDFEAASTHFKHTDVSYVPGVGVDTESIYSLSVNADAKKKELKLPADKKIILTVAELIHRKNIEASIRAFAGSKHNDSILVICGKGVLLKELKDLSKELDISDRVHFLGYRTDILDIYKISDLFLFTSRQEGLPVSIMQAMAAGLPIVASDIRGNRDLLKPYDESLSKDYLVSVDDIEGFTNHIDTILSDQELMCRIGSENYSNCKKYFDISIVHKAMKNIYENLLNN